MAKMTSVGMRVLARRRALGLTRPALATRAHTSVSTIDRLETRGSMPNVVTVLGIARTLGIGLDDLFSDVETVGVSIDPSEQHL